MLTPLISILERFSKPKLKVETPSLASPAHPEAESPPRTAAAAPAPFAEELAGLWRDVQIANACEAKPLNFSQLVAHIKRDVQHPLYAVGIHTLRRHMLVIDPKRAKAASGATDVPGSAAVSQAPGPQRGVRTPPAAPFATPAFQADDEVAADVAQAPEAPAAPPATMHLPPIIEDPSCAAVTLMAPRAGTAPVPDAPATEGTIVAHSSEVAAPPPSVDAAPPTIITLHSDAGVDAEDTADFDDLHFLSSYARPVIVPGERFKWLHEQRPERLRLEGELTFI